MWPPKKPRFGGAFFCGSITRSAANTGPFPRALFGASSAREHQHDDEAGGDNCGLQIQRQREVGGGLEKFEEGGHAAIRQEGVRRPITLNGTMSADAKPAGDVSAPPRSLADWRLLCTRALTTLGTTASIPSRRERVALLWSASR